MSVSCRPAAELVKIVANGGGVRLDGARFTIPQLGSIAASADKGARVTLFNTDKIATFDLLGIAAHGLGCVSFE